MSIHKPGLEKIISDMVARRKQAMGSRPPDVAAVAIIESIIACAAHQLSLENGPWAAIKEGAEELLRQQARLMQYENHLE